MEHLTTPIATQNNPALTSCPQKYGLQQRKRARAAEQKAELKADYPVPEVHGGYNPDDEKVVFTPMGFLKSVFKNKYGMRCVFLLVLNIHAGSGTPRQGSIAPMTRASLTLDKEISPSALDGILDYSHVWVLTTAVIADVVHSFRAKRRSFLLSMPMPMKNLNPRSSLPAWMEKKWVVLPAAALTDGIMSASAWPSSSGSKAVPCTSLASTSSKVCTLAIKSLAHSTIHLLSQAHLFWTSNRITPPTSSQTTRYQRGC
jgi:hypothetical protein